AVRLARIRADAGRGVARARRVTLVAGGADDGVRADADAGRADVALGAGIAVVAGRGVVGVVAAGGRIAEVVGAGVAIVATRRCPTHAGTGSLAHVARVAGLAVIPSRAVGLARVRADAGRGVAASGRMALIAGGAHDRVAADAGTRLAGIGLGA